MSPRFRHLCLCVWGFGGTCQICVPAKNMGFCNKYGFRRNVSTNLPCLTLHVWYLCWFCLYFWCTSDICVGSVCTFDLCGVALCRWNQMTVFFLLEWMSFYAHGWWFECWISLQHPPRLTIRILLSCWLHSAVHTIYYAYMCWFIKKEKQQRVHHTYW